jgi:hypothetical protein
VNSVAKTKKNKSLSLNTYQKKKQSFHIFKGSSICPLNKHTILIILFNSIDAHRGGGGGGGGRVNIIPPSGKFQNTC